MKNLLIIQARTGSSRLPNKVLKEICGKPMLQHIIERVKMCENVDQVIVATTVRDNDQAIADICEQIGIDCYRGSESDVLDRYYQAACLYKPENVIRVTADCPLIDSKLIDEIIETHVKGNYDYTSNTLVETYPDGLDAEVFTFNALKKAWEEAALASEREHVTPYIKFKSDYKRYSVEREPSLKEKRWTVDTNEDFDMVLRIYDALYKDSQYFGTDEILHFLSEHGEIETINSGIIRNEGYHKSIVNDYVVKGVVENGNITRIL